MNNSEAVTDWLLDRFRHRGGGRPWLLRQATCAVFTDGEGLVAKVHQDALGGEREAAVADLLEQAGVPAARCIGLDPFGPRSVTWWRRLPFTAQAGAVETCQWLRTLHDASEPPGWLVPKNPHADGALPEAEDLAERMRPWLTTAAALMDVLRTQVVNAVCVHGDANPTNIVVVDGEVTGLDFGSAGAGDRSLDLATVTVLAVETRQGSLGDVLETVLNGYGPHPDVSEDKILTHAEVIAASRAAACLRVPGWLAEGEARLAAHHAGRPYVFGTGQGPK